MVINIKNYNETLNEQLKNNEFKKEYNNLESEYQINRENLKRLDNYNNKEKNIIKNKEEFWLAIIGDSKSYIEKLYKVLSARGFLLELRNGDIHMLDNNHFDDFDYLDMIFNELGIGCVNITEKHTWTESVLDKYSDNYLDKTHIVKKAVLEIKNEIDIDILINKMLITDRIGMVCQFGWLHQWWWFLDRINCEKVPVNILETYIARYVKGLSACGLATAVSCDGNHEGSKNKVWIGFENYPNDLFYEAICNNVLYKKFNYKYKSKMRFNSESQYKLYYKLNIAGEFLFNNRDYFKNIKKVFYDRYDQSYVFVDKNSEKIELDFVEYLKTAFCDFEKNCY